MAWTWQVSSSATGADSVASGGAHSGPIVSFTWHKSSVVAWANHAWHLPLMQPHVQRNHQIALEMRNRTQQATLTKPKCAFPASSPTHCQHMHIATLQYWTSNIHSNKAVPHAELRMLFQSGMYHSPGRSSISGRQSCSINILASAIRSCHSPDLVSACWCPSLSQDASLLLYLSLREF